MKLIKKDINEELEKVLEEKKIEEHAKNLLQGILYKIEISYKDYKKAKVVEKTEEEYTKELIKNIQSKCNEIKTVKLSEKVDDTKIQSELEKNKYYIEKNNIISYPIENKILYAIQRQANNKKIVNNRYGIVTLPISNLINTGKSIDRVEPLRDFNGWSWTTIKKEIENIDANLIYQTIRLLLGENFIDGWTQDTDGIIDYFAIMKERLESDFGQEKTKEFIHSLEKVSVINEANNSEEYKTEIEKELVGLRITLAEYENTKENVQKITEHKKAISEEIKNIETILSQESNLKKEYERRNKDVPLNQKIFSIRVLKQKLIDRKNQLLNEIEEKNYFLNPKNYIVEKEKIKRKKELLELVDIDKKQKEKILIEFETIFLEFLKTIISKAEEKTDIVKLIYEFRYFLLIPFNEKSSIKNVKELKEKIEEIEKVLVKKAIEKKIISNMPIEIMSHVFETRIITLEELYYKISKENDKIYVQIFDENISEEKFELKQTENTKINKKIKIFN